METQFQKKNVKNGEDLEVERRKWLECDTWHGVCARARVCVCVCVCVCEEKPNEPTTFVQRQQRRASVNVDTTVAVEIKKTR